MLDAVVQEDFAETNRYSTEESIARESSSGKIDGRDDVGSDTRTVRAVAWNIERGSRLQGIVEAFRKHPVLRTSELLLLTELDWGMARSGNRIVPRELAEALRLNYVFAPCYIALNKGSGLEAESEGENEQALHGNALMSRYKLGRAHSLALPNGKDKLAATEKRLGSQRAVIADVAHPAGEFRAVSLHLDAHSTPAHRHLQMRLLLEHLERLQPQMPTVIGGDWNTITYNSSRAFYAIIGFWRTVLLTGVRRTLEEHFPNPDRRFERKLFRELETRGFSYKALNQPGGCTLHYDVRDLSAFKNMSEWIPRWCFDFIEWALRDHGGRCSIKLDWFAGKGILPVHERFAPRVVTGLRDPEKDTPLSDHDAIALDFRLDTTG